MAGSLNSDRPASVDRLVALIQTLRGANGCPWDRKQTPDTMTRYLIEEVYELADAIASRRPADICEEAGDVLFQLLFVIYLFGESGDFSLEDVVITILSKMVRRHPHVFGDATAKTPQTVSKNWDKIKRQEKGLTNRHSVLRSIPKGLPALLRAAMVSERAAKTGFDWDDIHGVMDKTMEEWQEFSKEIATPDSEPNSQKAAMEFGDLLFTMVNVARFAHIHPETALIQSIQKFERRFIHMEEKALEAGRELNDLTAEEMHALWNRAKEGIE